MRWIVRSLIALVLLALLAVGSLFLIPTEKIAGLATGEFRRLTGRDLVIEGSVRPTIWPVLGVTTGKVSVSNAEWSSEGPMFSAEGLAISVDLQALIGGAVRITDISADTPRIVLERSVKGKENWVFGGGGADGAVSEDTPGVGAPFTLDAARFSGGTLIFADHGTGLRHEITGLSGEVRLPDYEGAAQVDLAGRTQGQDFTLRAAIAAFKDFLDGGLVGLDLKAGAGRADIAFAGKASLTGPEMVGAITADLGNLAEISALAGAPAPALPAGLGRESLSLSGDLTLTAKGTVHLRGGKVSADGNSASLDADLEPGGERPMLKARIGAGTLNLGALTGGGGGEGGASSSGWSRAEMDLTGLRALDAEVSIAAEAIDLGLVKLAPAKLGITLERGRMVTDLRKVGAYGGTIGGNFVINARKGLSMGGDLAFSGMDLQPLMTDFAGIDRLVGEGDLSVKFVGSGASMQQIMNSLEGGGSLSLGQGEIRGLDIEGMITNLDPGYVGEGRKTVYDNMTASFSMAGGVIRNEDLVMNSPYLKAEGKGEIGLGARDMDYRIRATGLREADGSGGVAVPLLIRGPWSALSYSLDLEALAEERLAEEAAKLEEEARKKAAELEAEANARLKAELEKATGGQVQEGESLEDAAKRLGNEVIEDEADKALKKLLGISE